MTPLEDAPSDASPESARLFSQVNLDALVSHLPPDALSAAVVEALRSAATQEDAGRRLDALVVERIEEKRGELNATAPHS